jgi:hypothetical protein
VSALFARKAGLVSSVEQIFGPALLELIEVGLPGGADFRH